MANSADSDETPHSAASHLGLHCLLRPVCPNSYGKYGTSSNFGTDKVTSYIVQILSVKMEEKYFPNIKCKNGR